MLCDKLNTDKNQISIMLILHGSLHISISILFLTVSIIISLIKHFNFG